jgi:lysophospholipase L1-like esterase
MGDMIARGLAMTPRGRTGLTDRFASNTLTATKGAGQDCNALVDEGHYVCGAGIVNNPEGFAGTFHLVVHRLSDIWALQLAFEHANPARCYHRVVDARTPAGIYAWNALNPKQFRKWMAVGDSITMGTTLSYAKRANDYLQYQTFTNLGVGGTSMALRGGAYADYDTHSFVSQATQPHFYETNYNFADYNLLTIAYGTNDWGTNVPLGTIDSTLNTEFYGAMNVGISSIYAANPKINLMFLTPIYRNNAATATNANGLKLRDYCEAILGIGEKYNIPVIDSYKLSGFNQVTCQTLLSDGIHPTADGAIKYGAFIAGQIQAHL